MNSGLPLQNHPARYCSSPHTARWVKDCAGASRFNEQEVEMTYAQYRRCKCSRSASFWGAYHLVFAWIAFWTVTFAATLLIARF